VHEEGFQEVRQSLAKALLLLTSLAVCLLGLELLCRFYLQPHANETDELAGPHPVFGRHFKPGQKVRYVAARFDQYIEINSKGLRDREYSYEKRGRRRKRRSPTSGALSKLMVPVLPP